MRRDFLAEDKKVKNDSEYLWLLWRLLARLEDGHAEVRPLEAGKDVKVPEEYQKDRTGPGMFWCRIGDKLYVKSSYAGAESSGVAGSPLLPDEAGCGTRASCPPERKEHDIGRAF